MSSININSNNISDDEVPIVESRNYVEFGDPYLSEAAVERWLTSSRQIDGKTTATGSLPVGVRTPPSSRHSHTGVVTSSPSSSSGGGVTPSTTGSSPGTRILRDRLRARALKHRGSDPNLKLPDFGQQQQQQQLNQRKNVEIRMFHRTNSETLGTTLNNHNNTERILQSFHNRQASPSNSANFRERDYAPSAAAAAASHQKDTRTQLKELPPSPPLSSHRNKSQSSNMSSTTVSPPPSPPRRTTIPARKSPIIESKSSPRRNSMSSHTANSSHNVGSLTEPLRNSSGGAGCGRSKFERADQDDTPLALPNQRNSPPPAGAAATPKRRFFKSASRPGVEGASSSDSETADADADWGNNNVDDVNHPASPNVSMSLREVKSFSPPRSWNQQQQQHSVKKESRDLVQKSSRGRMLSRAGGGAAIDHRQSHPPPVPKNNIQLHVYDLIASGTIMQLPWGCHFPIGMCFGVFNSSLHSLGTGAYHVGIEVRNANEPGALRSRHSNGMVHCRRWRLQRNNPCSPFLVPWCLLLTT
jgi:hypothetical protein